VHGDNAAEFYNMLDTSRMVHIVTDRGGCSSQGEQGVRNDMKALSAGNEQYDGSQGCDRSVATTARVNGCLVFNVFEPCQA
jgi:hypothetical protein